MKDPLIQEEIKRRKDELFESLKVDRDRITQELVGILDSNILDYMEVETFTDTIEKMNYNTGAMEEEEVIRTRYNLKDLSSLSVAKQKCIKSIEMTKCGPKVTLYDKLDAIEKLNKMLGLYEQTISFDTKIDTGFLKDLSLEDLEKLLK